jgi:hypothetical protein
MDADTSPGLHIRRDLPIAKYVTVGPLVGVYAARPDFRGLDRNVVPKRASLARRIGGPELATNPMTRASIRLDG